MTEDPNVKDDYLVRVKAQVMTRDDSSGGWVPLGGGGMSQVGLRLLVVNGNDGELHHEYHIHGQKMADRSVVLNCVLKKDVQYIKANPTFHHWKTEDKRFGLTFQSSADARTFDKGVKRAVEDLVEGCSDTPDLGELGDDEVFMQLDLPLGRKDSWSASGGASTASTTTSSPSPQSPAAFSLHDTFAPPPLAHYSATGRGHLHRIHYMPAPPRHRPPPPPPTAPADSPHSSPTMTQWGAGDGGGIKSDNQGAIISAATTDDNLEITDFSYVEFNKNKPVPHSPPPPHHDYSYPELECVSYKSQPSSTGRLTIGQPSPLHSRRDSTLANKHHLDLQPQLPTKSKKKKKPKLKKVGGGQKKQCLLSQRSRCVYCHEMFVHDENARGHCEDAPDKVAECIEKVSCVCCARSMMYHCMADADGDYGRHPCACGGGDDDDTASSGAAGNCRKWTALAVLALFVPCLWCYWPLTACHKCGVACSCCGGRHKAA